MVRYTHVEAESGTLVAHGHQVVVHAGVPDPTSAAPPRTPLKAPSAWLLPALQWICVAALLVLRELSRFAFRGFVMLAAMLIVPLVHELACIGGALVLYPVGATGRLLATAVEHAGTALSHRSLVLGFGRHVIGTLERAVRRPPSSTSLAKGREGAP